MFENKKIYILGMARSGYEVAKMLAKKNNEILVTDLKEQNESHINELKSLGVQIIIGNAPMIDNSYDYLVKNPGIKDSHDIVTKAKELNIPVLNEIELAYRLIDKDATIVGITGSNGKTTTTMLTYEILKNAKKKVILAGNMGFPLSPFVDEIDKDTILLMEISIQQLCNFSEYKTNISVLTNIYEAHLDFVGSKENYINIKKRIFNHHTSSDYAVLNYDNKDVVDNTNDIMSHKEYFSKNNNDALCHIEDDWIYYDNKKLIKLSDIKLKGNHNYENVMAAVMVAKRLDTPDEVICDTLKEFNGVEHRIEYVTNIDGVEIYNDSKSTNVKATQIALSTFNKPTILLLGGLDRKHSFEGLTEYMTNVKLIISFGETKDRIKEYADSINKDCIVVDNLKEATDTALSKAVFGDVVLLSPACASWDQFDSFEQRGEIFKSYINGGKIMSRIKNVIGREVLDSRGNPTVEVDVILESGILGRAIVPSGASTGEREALELRDGGTRYMGKGVLTAVNNVNTVLRNAVIGMDSLDQEALDRKMIELDGTKTKSKLGANAILGISMANLKAAALYKKLPLYRYIGEGKTLPVAMMNIINGGAHADNPLDIQEFMIVPKRDTMKERVRVGAEVFHNLKKILKENGMVTAVGDEGGFAPNIKSNEEAIKFIINAIEKAGYKPGVDVSLALDVAASELYKDGHYEIEGKVLSTSELIDYYEYLVNNYPICSIEDPVDENDWDGFRLITERLGSKIQLVGDDLFVTNKECLQKGIDNKAGNAILLKVNQIGTITETLETIDLAKKNGYKTVISHRSGETEDTIIAHLAVGLDLGQIKTGSMSRTDRICKYNELMRIEEELNR